MHHFHPARSATVANLVHPPSQPDMDRPSLAAFDYGPLRVAVVHDWCPDFRGGERVLARICRHFPHAEIFTLFDFLPAEIKEQYFHDIAFHTSAANRLPMIRRFYRSLFFLCPFLIEQFDVTGYDLVVSSSAAFARGVITRPDQPHLCYVHSPVRYAWDEQFNYLEQGGLGFGPGGLLFRVLLHGLRVWDTRTANGPDLMLANSSYVRSRIRRTYGRDARIVFPPVETNDVAVVQNKSDYYVAASYLVPYKRMDLVIGAFNETPERRLVVVGDGPQSKTLRAMAGPNVSFTGFVERPEFIRIVSEARAMVFAGCEDFGITLAEAQACGTPLVAYGRGGACDIVRPLGGGDHPTGVLFSRQTVPAIKEALSTFERLGSAISPRACGVNASRFSTRAFDQGFAEALSEMWALH